MWPVLEVHLHICDWPNGGYGESLRCTFGTQMASHPCAQSCAFSIGSNPNIWHHSARMHMASLYVKIKMNENKIKKNSLEELTPKRFTFVEWVQGKRKNATSI